MMLKRKDANLSGKQAVMDAVRKPSHHTIANLSVHDPPTLGSLLDLCNRGVHGLEEFSAKGGNTALVKQGSLDEFSLGVLMVDQAHPIARRAACMTSSWLRPTTAPEESS